MVLYTNYPHYNNVTLYLIPIPVIYRHTSLNKTCFLHMHRNGRKQKFKTIFFLECFVTKGDVYNLLMTVYDRQE